MKKIILGFVLLLVLLVPRMAFAGLGVGIGTGKIVVDEKLKSGIIYNLPSLTIVNTGDISADYKVSVAYHTDQKEIRPSMDWFTFSPPTFKLAPGESQVVDVKLNLPLRTEPGSYFAYLEGSPLIKSENGQSSVGIAAAAKLYFEIEPSNIFEAMYYKVISFFNVYAPWPLRVTILIGIVAVAFVLKRFLNIEIHLKKPANNTKKKDE